MSGEERRKEIVKFITGSSQPVSGSKLADYFCVSRQVIVQDIALIRAEGTEVFSTNRGYICRMHDRVKGVFYVHHDNSRIQEELNLIVDNGGSAEDVFVHHEIYGELRAELKVDSRKKASEFIKEIASGKSSPLNTITSGYHYHTVTAESEDILDAIEAELKEKGFLIG
ncbi:transcription repressor NadR [Blautia sp. HCP3S3_G3]|uniref:transcription repressor NadR n=1 Tax=Blautia sp. HCP3S3_G3 TaxID=3438913 RepID=UPI003F8C82AA